MLQVRTSRKKNEGGGYYKGTHSVQRRFGLYMAKNKENPYDIKCIFLFFFTLCRGAVCIGVLNRE